MKYILCFLLVVTSLLACKQKTAAEQAQDNLNKRMEEMKREEDAKRKETDSLLRIIYSDK